MLIKKVRLGADPELFMERENEIISAEGLIGGTKKKPKAISMYGHFIQEDNVLIEFNIPASDTKDDFVENMEFVLDYLNTLVSLQNGKLSFRASAELDKKWLQTDQAKEFGCDPDFNVYSKGINIPPENNEDVVLRTAGGHIHIGYETPDVGVSEKIVLAMDMVLGLESIILDPDDRRKEMYGKAGAFRFKDYGVEYRTLSNFWIKDKESMEWAYDKTMQAIELVNTGLIEDLVMKHGKSVETIINNNDKEAAKALLANIKEFVEEKLIKIKN